VPRACLTSGADDGMRSMVSTAVSAFKRRARRYPLLVSLRNAVRRPTPPPSGKQVIEKYLRDLRPGDDLKILFGGHWSNNPGWLLLNEEHQDITRPLDFPDGVADVVFSEHVIEHVPFVSAVHFMRESFRILKPGGVCRVICPMLDRLMTAKLDDAPGREYVRTSLIGIHQDADDILRQTLGLDGVNEEPLPFLFTALYMNHGHRFIWTSTLMIKVMKQIGFSRAARYQPGEGSRSDACIERRRRGIYLGHDWREELRDQHATYDVESFVLEAIK
jgi:SAM-dependent methyltransferase